MDILKAYHEFSTEVAEALNAAGVRPVKDGEEECCAVMCIIFPAEGPGEGREPVGGSLNWKEDKQKWEADIQLQEPQRVS